MIGKGRAWQLSLSLAGYFGEIRLFIWTAVLVWVRSDLRPKNKRQMTPDNNITNRARVSIAKRLVPSMGYALAAVSGAMGAVIVLQFLAGLRNAETAGFAAFFRGTSEIELAMGIVLGVSAALGACGILVSLIRMFTTNTTASPPGALFLVVGLLSLVPPLAIHYGLHLMEGVVISHVPGGISTVGETEAVIAYFAILAPVVIVLVLLAFSFIPFSSRLRRKISPIVFLIIVEIAVLGLMGIFFWQAIQAMSAAGRWG